MTESPITHDTLHAVRNYTKFHVLAELNRAVAVSGVSIEQLAARLGWSPRKVRRLLDGVSELHVDKMGATLFAIDGSLVKLEVRPAV